MGYKKDLEKALSVSDCQISYEKECSRRLKKYCKEDFDNATARMICEDFGVWLKAEKRAVEIMGYEKRYDSFVESKY